MNKIIQTAMGLGVILFSGCANHVSWDDARYVNQDRVSTKVDYTILTDTTAIKPEFNVKIQKNTHRTTKTYRLRLQKEYYVPYSGWHEIWEVPFGCAAAPLSLVLGLFIELGGDVPQAQKGYNFSFACINPFINHESYGRTISKDHKLSSKLTGTKRKVKKSIPDTGKKVTVKINDKSIINYHTDSQGQIKINLTDKEYIDINPPLRKLELCTVMKTFSSIEKGASVSLSSILTQQLRQARPIILKLKPQKSASSLAKTIFALEKQKLSVIADALQSSEIEKHQNDTEFMNEYEKALNRAD